jgi:undecaprenyl-diphosphatase
MRRRLFEIEQEFLRSWSSHERHAGLRFVMLLATRLADGWGVIALIPLALAFGREKAVPAIACGVIAGVVAALIAQSIKALVRRARPSGLVLGRPITAPDKHAFPSGHTAQAFAVLVIAAWTSPWLGAFVAPVAACVGASRMFFGLHYPSDVVAGAVLGAATSTLTLVLAEHFGLVAWLMRISPLA